MRLQLDSPVFMNNPSTVEGECKVTGYAPVVHILIETSVLWLKLHLNRSTL